MTDYSLWEQELERPNSVDRLSDERPKNGFWRIQGARTKHDTPCAIWDDPMGGPVIKWGRKDPIAFDAAESQKFDAWSWLHARAVTETAYNQAVMTGEWADDGKPSRERDPNAVTNERAAPGQSNYASTAEVLSERITEIIGQIDAIGDLTTMELATKATELGQRLKAVYEEAVGARAKELAPAEEEVAKINIRWTMVLLTDGYLQGLRLKIRAFLKHEHERLIEAQTTAGADGTASEGDPPSPSPEPASAAPNPRVTTAYGRAITLRTVRKGVITDKNTFIKSVWSDPDLDALLQKKANAFARANSKQPGMTITEDKA